MKLFPYFARHPLITLLILFFFVDNESNEIVLSFLCLKGKKTTLKYMRKAIFSRESNEVGLL